jgi:hypothetical protein
LSLKKFISTLAARKINNIKTSFFRDPVPLWEGGNGKVSSDIFRKLTIFSSKGREKNVLVIPVLLLNFVVTLYAARGTEKLPRFINIFAGAEIYSRAKLPTTARALASVLFKFKFDSRGAVLLYAVAGVKRC